jgi:hypothetical protein
MSCQRPSILSPKSAAGAAVAPIPLQVMSPTADSEEKGTSVKSPRLLVSVVDEKKNEFDDGAGAKQSPFSLRKDSSDGSSSPVYISVDSPSVSQAPSSISLEALLSGMAVASNSPISSPGALAAQGGGGGDAAGDQEAVAAAVPTMRLMPLMRRPTQISRIDDDDDDFSNDFDASKLGARDRSASFQQSQLSAGSASFISSTGSSKASSRRGSGPEPMKRVGSLKEDAPSVASGGDDVFGMVNSNILVSSSRPSSSMVQRKSFRASDNKDTLDGELANSTSSPVALAAAAVLDSQFTGSLKIRSGVGGTGSVAAVGGGSLGVDRLDDGLFNTHVSPGSSKRKTLAHGVVGSASARFNLQPTSNSGSPGSSGPIRRSFKISVGDLDAASASSIRGGDDIIQSLLTSAKAGGSSTTMSAKLSPRPSFPG